MLLSVQPDYLVRVGPLAQDKDKGLGSPHTSSVHLACARVTILQNIDRTFTCCVCLLCLFCCCCVVVVLVFLIFAVAWFALCVFFGVVCFGVGVLLCCYVVCVVLCCCVVVLFCFVLF